MIGTFSAIASQTMPQALPLTRAWYPGSRAASSSG